MENEKKSQMDKAPASQKESKVTNKVVKPADEKAAPKGKKKSNSESFRAFLCDRERGACLGRTCKEWLRVFIFYVLFFTVLGAFLAGLVFLIQSQFLVAGRRPNYAGKYTLAMINKDEKTFAVKLGIAAPISEADREKRLVNKISIKYNAKDADTYNTYVNSMRRSFLGYRPTLASSQLNCSDEDKVKEKNQDSDGKSCHVNLFNSDAANGYGDCACLKGSVEECDFGYPNKPCVALGFNKVIGWTPNRNESAKVQLICVYKQNDKDVALDTYPRDGIPNYFYPYPGKCPKVTPAVPCTGEDHYQRPLLMVQLPQDVWTKSNGTISVRCNASEASPPRYKHGEVTFTVTVRF